MNNDARRARFIAAAEELFEEKGTAKTSVGDIAARVGVARSLFYHYFPDKDAIVDAVIDRRVDEFVDHVTQWNRQYQATHSHESLEEIVLLIKSYLLGSHSLVDATLRKENAFLRQRFTTRSADRLAKKYAENSAQAQASGARRSVYRASVRYPYETYYVAAVGLMSLLNRNPDVDDEIIIDLIIGALDLGR